jgi:hypothetical protein
MVLQQHLASTTMSQCQHLPCACSVHVCGMSSATCLCTHVDLCCCTRRYLESNFRVFPAVNAANLDEVVIKLWSTVGAGFKSLSDHTPPHPTLLLPECADRGACSGDLTHAAGTRVRLSAVLSCLPGRLKP